jgi:predicted transport protein
MRAVERPTPPESQPAMPDPVAATETQLRNIEAATGMSVTAFAAAVAERGIEGHAKTLAFLKAEYGLSHGNANAVALRVRELAAGGPASSDALLDAQYAGGKAALRPVYERLAAMAAHLGPDVEILVQKTGVAFRRRKQFALVQAASAKRVALGLNLGAAPQDPRVVATPSAMCAFRVDLADVETVDGDVAAWLREGYEQAG